MTIDAALRRAAEALTEAGVPDAPWQAELLLRYVLRWDRAALLARGRETLPGPERTRLEALVAERARRRPLQHLTGTQAFWRHEFLVTPDVLIPRPETEVLVEAALDIVRGRPAPVVVDVGTGSGCIALSLAAERPDATVHATSRVRSAIPLRRRRPALRRRQSPHMLPVPQAGSGPRNNQDAGERRRGPAQPPRRGRLAATPEWRAASRDVRHWKDWRT